LNTKDTIIHIVIPILAAAISGLVVFWLTPNWEKTARSKGWVPIAEWKHEAEKNGWIEKTECPAYPLKISLIGPGNGSKILISKSGYDHYWIQTDLVIRLSKKIDRHGNIDFGVIIKSEEEDNFYIVFPHESDTTISKDEKVIRFDRVYIPFEPKKSSTFQLWIVAVDDSTTIGARYISFDDIKNQVSTLSVSDAILVSIEID
jgi:hypothetical protein